MIRGAVNSEREATIPLTVHGSMGRAETVAAIVDTGFDGELALPLSLLNALQLPPLRRSTATLGDGSTIVHTVHRATILWDGTARRVFVAALDSEPLVGMELLAGYRLTIQVIPGGQVLIESLATPR